MYYQTSQLHFFQYAPKKVYYADMSNNDATLTLYIQDQRSSQ